MVADLHKVGIKDSEAKEASYIIYRHLRPVNQAILEHNNQAYAHYWNNLVLPYTEYQTMMKLMENWMSKGVLGRNSTAPYSILATLRNWWNIELVYLS
ncbi:hypothetical protein RvY_11563 [Ramazzottius varieornatus]|uniref:Uncharacterized protein n=1 Tax=Ramazzottius varieornatus TaxID=947166 RepID=A0A1D1VIK7_RAMVA|nr:hypothetical protein RvY_11563 [Ramazzottius varieornatus]